jgi:hypothetical protein
MGFYGAFATPSIFPQNLQVQNGEVKLDELLGRNVQHHVATNRCHAVDVVAEGDVRGDPVHYDARSSNAAMIPVAM